MGRHFTTQPSTEAGRKLAEAISKTGLAVLADQLGIDLHRLRKLVNGEREATVTEVLVISAAGIATLLDWSRPAEARKLVG